MDDATATTPPFMGGSIPGVSSTSTMAPSSQMNPQMIAALLKMLAAKQGQSAPGGQTSQGTPAQIGGPPPQMQPGGSGAAPPMGQLPMPAAQPQRQGYQASPYGAEMMSKLDPQGAATYSAVSGVQQLLQNWQSRKDQKEQAEAANIANNLMTAMSNNDTASVHEILNDKNSTKVLNKVYKGWLQKSQDAQQPSDPPDPAVAGFEKGIKQYQQKKGQQVQQSQKQQPQSPTGGYRLPMQGPAQQLQSLQQQNAIRQQQAQLQQPASPYTPEQQAAIYKATSDAQIAALGVQKAQQEAQKSMTDAQSAASKGQAEGEKAVSDAKAAMARAQMATTNLEIAKTKLQIAKNGGKITPITQSKINGAKSALDIIDSITGGKGDSTTNTLTGLKNSLIIAGLPGLAKQVSEGGNVKPTGFSMHGSVKSTPTSSDELKRIRPQIQTFYDGITKTGTEDVQPSADSGGADIVVDPGDVQ